MDPTNLLQPPQPILPPQPGTGVQTQASPEELRAMYEYSRALQSNQMPVRSWTQGVSNMVNALMGGMVGNRADALARQGQQQTGENLKLPNPANLPPLYDNAPSSKKTAPQGGALNFASTGGSDAIIDRAQAATTQQESGGDYGAVGPNTKYGPALGKYQVLTSNVGPWTKEVLGREMSPQEFLRDKAAQDSVYRAKMGQYIQKYGVEGAGQAWLGGEGGVGHPGRADAFGTTIGDYGKKFASLVGGGGQTGGALAFNGTPATGNPSDASNAIVMALQRRAGGAAPAGGQVAQAPVGQYGAPIVPPGVIPGQSGMTRMEITNILNSRTADPALKALAYQMYMGTQVNPQIVPVPGGKILVNPANRSQQFFIPDLHKGAIEYPEGYKAPIYQTLQPMGEQVNRVPNAPAPAVTTVPVKPGAPAGGPNALPQPGGATPFAPETPPGPQGAAEAPFKVASAGPNIPVPANAAASPMGAGPLGATPPPLGPQNAPAATASPIPPVAPPAAAMPPQQPAAISPVPSPTEKNPVTQVAQNVPKAPVPPGVDPQDWAAIQGFQRNEIQQASAKEGATAGAKNYSKRLDAMNTAALKSREEILPHMEQAMRQLDNPDFISGVGVNALVNWKKMQATLAQIFPNAGFDKYAGSPNQIFTKDIADAILTNMRSALGGLGQVRIKEIELLEKAMASPHNTVEANRTLLGMAIRTQQRLNGFAEMAQDYASGAAVVNPFSQEHEVVVPPTPDGSPRAGGNIDAGFDRLLTKFVKEHPPYTPEEIDNQKGVWERDKVLGAAGGKGPPKISNKAERDALPDNTPYIGPDGKPYVKGKTK